MKDPNRVARIEKAIAKKYGHEAVENPRKHWNEEKEKSYQDQIKKLAEKERAFEESEEKLLGETAQFAIHFLLT
jgi:N-methylhydantoinase B/oxoprolinase/acetone carboxylase alpha subunit